MGVMARDINHREVAHDSEEAFCFCCLAALRVCYPDDDAREAVKNKIYGVIGAQAFISVWNDRSSYDDVHKVLKELDV